MKKIAKVLCYMISISLFMGCGVKSQRTEKETREVSSEFRSMYEGCGLLVEQGELKNSEMLFSEEEVVFQDSVVEEMIRNMIQKPEGAVYHKDLEELHAIYWRYDTYWSNLQSDNGELPQNGIGPWTIETEQPKTWDDFVLCGNLQWMEFGSIEVTSMQAFQDLELLETLSFHGTSITKEALKELSEIKTVKRLWLATGDGMDWSQVTNGEFLLPMKDQLVDLAACGSVEWDTDVLKELKNLEQLDIENVNDLSFLNELTNLKKMSMYCPNVEDWSPLRECQNLEYLEIGGNMKFKPKPDVTLEDLQSLKKLDYLSLWFTQLQEEHSREEIIEALPGLTGLYLL